MARAVLIVIVGCAVAATSAAGVAAQSPPVDEKSYAELVQANYVILSRAKSEKLVRYAAAFARCLTNHGEPVGAPHATKTKITMAIPHGTDRARLNQQTVQRFGDTHAVVLYVPRRCLLDPKVAAS